MGFGRSIGRIFSGGGGGGFFSNPLSATQTFFRDPAGQIQQRDLRNIGRTFGRQFDDLARDPSKYGEADFKDLVDGTTLSATSGVMGGGDRERGGLLLGAMLAGGGVTGPGIIGLGSAGAAAGWYLGSLEKQRMEENRLMNEQEELARRAGETQARQIAQVRDAYGYLQNGMSSEARAKAHERRAAFGSAVEGGAEALRDANLAPLLEGAQSAANQARFSASRAGLIGSSIDQQNRQNVLSSFTAGRANIASGMQQQRAGAWNNLNNERVQMENAVRSNGNAGLEQMFAAQRGMNAIKSATANVIPAAFGNMLGNAGVIGAQGTTQMAQGNAGLQAFGLPNFTKTGQGKTAGATTTSGAS